MQLVVRKVNLLSLKAICPATGAVLNEPVRLFEVAYW